MLPGRWRWPRVPWQAVLWLATAATTFASGVVGWQPVVLGLDADVVSALPVHWARGLAYMLAVLAVLGAHEAGHFVAARIHGIPATLPFFLPVPVMLTGTLGAVIGMEGSRANRRQLFDIALAGPLAGLVLAVPALVMGMVGGAPNDDPLFAMPPLARWLMALVRPDLLASGGIEPNPLYMAGWVGLLVTGLNMIPISQLDGGHVVYALFGPRANWLARSLLIAAIAGIVLLGRYNWIIMVVLVTLIGADHPPIRDEGTRLDRFRTALGLASLLIPLVTFMPEPLRLD
ncbi:MAG: site-2 protease family protein [Planctomycetia bacterium]|nr:site-2 protease family protein [Planctomycetia bacterium]